VTLCWAPFPPREFHLLFEWLLNYNARWLFWRTVHAAIITTTTANTLLEKFWSPSISSHKSDANAVNTPKRGFCRSSWREKDNKVHEIHFLWQQTFTWNKFEVFFPFKAKLHCFTSRSGYLNIERIISDLFPSKTHENSENCTSKNLESWAQFHQHFYGQRLQP